jgi:hypothetical protein
VTAQSDPPQDDEDDDHSMIILSVTAFSEERIDELATFEVPWEDGVFRYDVGHVDFEEPDWDRRADVLNDMLNENIARLAPVADALHAPGAWVRFFLTLPRGAETIAAETVRGLASVNATLWIDA